MQNHNDYDEPGWLTLALGLGLLTLGLFGLWAAWPVITGGWA